MYRATGTSPGAFCFVFPLCFFLIFYSTARAYPHNSARIIYTFSCQFIISCPFSFSFSTHTQIRHKSMHHFRFFIAIRSQRFRCYQRKSVPFAEGVVWNPMDGIRTLKSFSCLFSRRILNDIQLFFVDDITLKHPLEKIASCSHGFLVSLSCFFVTCILLSFATSSQVFFLL